MVAKFDFKICFYLKIIKNYPSSTMKKLERHCGFNIGSFLSKDIVCSTYLAFKEETIKLVEKYFQKCNISEFNVKSENNFGVELTLYHEFVGGLMLLDALHFSWMKLENVTEVTKQLLKYFFILNIYSLFRFSDWQYSSWLFGQDISTTWFPSNEKH